MISENILLTIEYPQAAAAKDMVNALHGQLQSVMEYSNPSSPERPSMITKRVHYPNSLPPSPSSPLHRRDLNLRDGDDVEASRLSSPQRQQQQSQLDSTKEISARYFNDES